MNDASNASLGTVTYAFFLSTIATMSMLYVSMVAPFGPWIAPSLILLSLLPYVYMQKIAPVRSILLAVSAASVGGIMATAVGFCVPTLFFADKIFFTQWLSFPCHFAAAITAITLCAGFLGVMCASILERCLIQHAAQFSFPLSTLLYGLLEVQKSVRSVYMFTLGGLGTLLVCAAQDGLLGSILTIPHTISVVPACVATFFNGTVLHIVLWPMVWAMGFIAGYAIIYPFVIGILLNSGIICFMYLNGNTTSALGDIKIAFCSGMILATVLSSTYTFAKQYASVDAMNRILSVGHASIIAWFCNKQAIILSSCCLMVVMVVVGTIGTALILSILFVVLGAVASSYGMMYMIASLGIAPLGRFATLVMLPVMFFYTQNACYLTGVSVFVAVCSGVAADVFSVRMLARKCGINVDVVRQYQYFGLFTAALIVGLAFVWLVRCIPLGSSGLCAHKAQVRALLCMCTHYNWTVIGIGLIHGLLVQRMGIHIAGVLSGLLMPLQLALGFIIGALISLISVNKDRWEPCVAGIFVSSCLWTVLRLLFGLPK
jgi:hypothetical protein